MSDVKNWRGAHMLENAYKEVEDTIRRLFSPYAEGSGPTAPAWTPRIDLAENETAFVIKADLPGVDVSDVDITLHENVLTIEGECRELREDKGATYHKVERSIGKFLRQVPLPSAVDSERVTATTANGVITLTVPKKAGATPKKIAINAGA